MKKFSKICALLLMVLLVMGIVPIECFSVGDEFTATDIEADLYEQYVEEMKSLGFTQDSIDLLSDWSKRMNAASEPGEIDVLLNEYRDLIEGTQIDTTSTRLSFYNAEGGTVMLDYIGELSPIANVIYTKVVYMGSPQVVFYQNALYTEDILDFIEDELLSAGITIITDAVSVAIAVKLGIEPATVTFLVGHSVNFLVWVLSNFDKWDLSDAIDRSTTGKVKLEFYYLTSISAPYYQEIENFEPWNSNYIDIPSGYEFQWFPDIYDYDESIHEHCYRYSSYYDGTHKARCGLCGDEFVEECTCTIEQFDSTQHASSCNYCNYVEYCGHLWNVDKTRCIVCGYIK